MIPSAVLSGISRQPGKDPRPSELTLQERFVAEDLWLEFKSELEIKRNQGLH